MAAKCTVADAKAIDGTIVINILLLEDDLVLGETIQEMLNERGYRCRWVIDGEKAAEAAYDIRYDLYIFDINVPKLNGFALVQSLRNAEDNTPTIFISAMTDIAAITQGFSVGADDYLKKPFYPQELLLRIEARFSRKTQLMTHGDISYSPITKEVMRQGHVLSLGDVQLPFLALFIANIGRTLSKENLFELMEHPSDNALRFAINKLKHTTGWNIENVRGIGYRIEKS
ncbi:response regulator transcription factor [Sulfuricurvum sp.]|uniref:response regulator transcription factor n=1 Tax=Sulfuricurvum sp. TaxID=2025608 RepID=UPI003BB60CDF